MIDGSEQRSRGTGRESTQRSAAWRRLVAGPLVWRLSGVTYPTAVVATHGRYVGRDEYLRNCAAQMAALAAEFHSGDRVVELGCGLGGNLIALAPRISFGLGLDVNPWFLRHARRLAAHCQAPHIRFRTVPPDGRFAERAPFDVGLSIGVFERLEASTVRAHVESLASHVRPGGRVLLYFLSSAARDLPMIDRLGPEAYVFWTESDAQTLVSGVTSLSVRSCRPWFGFGPPMGVAPAMLVIADRRESRKSAAGFDPPHASVGPADPEHPRPAR